MNAQLSLNLQELAILRRDAERAEKARREYLERLLADPELNDLTFTAKEIGDLLDAKEVAVRELILTVNGKNGEGKGDLPKGATAVKKHKISYQLAKVFKWCLVNAPEFMKLQTKDFESYALKVDKIKPVPDVTITEYWQAQIAKDLSEYLPTDKEE